MPTPQESGDASQNQDAPVVNRDATGKVVKRDPILSARDELLARMDEQIVDQRSADDETFFQQGDPRAVALAAEMGRESRGERISADRVQGRSAAAGEEADPILQEEGADPAADAAAEEAARAVRISTKGEDPLAEYVVRDNGKAMFKTVVDGKVHLVPLDKARAQLQKHLAADIRLQQATERQRGLDAREVAIRTTETQLRQRAAQPVVQPMDDAALERESTELVRSLVSQPEAVAAKRMAETLKKIRTAAPQIDVNAVARQASTLARQEIAAEDNVKALSSGLQDFTRDYPDISADPDLFALADRKTNAIAAEHPEWTPGQVMDEAGKQTREWVAGISGKPVVRKDPKSPTLPNNRQLVKQTLKPMPQARSARPAQVVDETGTSPSDALAEIRKSRGQAW
jgi:hypothetical protein